MKGFGPVAGVSVPGQQSVGGNLQAGPPFGREVELPAQNERKSPPFAKGDLGGFLPEPAAPLGETPEYVAVSLGGWPVVLGRLNPP